MRRKGPARKLAPDLQAAAGDGDPGGGVGLALQQEQKRQKRPGRGVKSQAPTRRANALTMGVVLHMHLIALTGCGKGGRTQ